MKNKLKVVQNPQQVIELLDDVVRSYPDISYQVQGIVSDLLNEYSNYQKIKNCNHKHTTGMKYAHHDSHYDWYENKCLDCGFILEEENY